MAILISGKVKEREAFQKLCQAEKEFDFYKLSYNKIPVWSCSREHAFFYINGTTSFKETISASFKINPINLLKRIASFAFGLNKIFGNEIIIFANERHLEEERQSNNFYNQYAELILEKNSGKKTLIFEFPAFMTTKYKKTNYEKYLPFDFIISIKKIFSFCSLFFHLKIKKEFYLKIKKANLAEEQDIKKILKFASRQAYSIKYYGIFLKIIKLLNPKAKQIYSCMGALDKFPEVTEIQHGQITEFHCQYIFPEALQIKEYIKNRKIIVFSDKVKEMLLLNGYLNQNIKVMPNPKIYFYFKKNITEDFFEKPISKEMVIISGFTGTIQETTKNFVFNIEENKDKFNDWNISLVLHPSEENIYKNLKLTKVKVFENHQVSLWKMLSSSLLMATIVSSVIEEAIYFGCFEIIIENKEMEDQDISVNWLAGDYPYKVKIPFDEFSEWFPKNENKIIDYWFKKMEIMKNNYETVKSK